MILRSEGAVIIKDRFDQSKGYNQSSEVKWHNVTSIL